MTAPCYENDPDDDDDFSIAIDDSILNEALAAVEKRMGRAQRDELDLGPLDLSALAAVEDELAIEVEEEDEAEEATMGDHNASVEARLRAMEAEAEAESLKEKLGSLSTNRDQIESQMRQLRNRASKAAEAQKLAEQRAKNLKEALEKQQKDVERLLERRKQEKHDHLIKGRTDTLLALADVIDNLSLAMQHAETDPLQVAAGVEMCIQQFEGGLQHIGVQTILPQPGDDFDPAIHEAIANEASSEVESGKILSIVSRGYRMDDRLIRAARVCVSNG